VAKRRAPRQPTRTASQRKLIAIAVGVAAIAVGAIALFAAAGRPAAGPTPAPTTSMQGTATAPLASVSTTPAASDAGSTDAHVAPATPPANAIACETAERLEYHVHAHVAVRVRGRELVVPGGIGITESCVYWLHTHGTSGIIHVEAPEAGSFTLGQFFGVWGQPLDDTHLGPYVVEPGESLLVYLDGSPWLGEPGDVPLSDLAVIELQIGSEPAPPGQYTFPPEFEAPTTTSSALAP